jgi:hypothetical protein
MLFLGYIYSLVSRVQEYIGDDKGVLHAAVKKTITLCCQQMKKRLLALHAAKEKESRRKKMSQYIPDVARSFMTLLTSIADADGSGSSMLPPPPAKRQKLDRMTPEQHQELVDRLRIQPHEQR